MGRVGLDGCDTEQRLRWLFTNGLEDFLFPSNGKSLLEGWRPISQKDLPDLGITDTSDQLLKHPSTEGLRIQCWESPPPEEPKGLLEVVDRLPGC
ncbi:unnamed protein product [Schistocephalus solidus]|uniref:PK_Tyr_Ser-Thr domain-containing protein n=1 Tax=Schistocephalus solidus TaxID=70667 RepID=A0A183TU80_SCHSO|nr:unnamed protein product [Schistocephalus solidus]